MRFHLRHQLHRPLLRDLCGVCTSGKYVPKEYTWSMSPARWTSHVQIYGSDLGRNSLRRPRGCVHNHPCGVLLQRAPHSEGQPYDQGDSVGVSEPCC